jgi:hypothetical protein
MIQPNEKALKRAKNIRESDFRFPKSARNLGGKKFGH